MVLIFKFAEPCSLMDPHQHWQSPVPRDQAHAQRWFSGGHYNSREQRECSAGMEFPWDSCGYGGTLLDSCPTRACQVLLWALRVRGTACCSYRSHISLNLRLPCRGNDSTPNLVACHDIFEVQERTWGAFWGYKQWQHCRQAVQGRLKASCPGRAGSAASGVQELVQIPWGAWGWLSQLLCICAPTASLLSLCFDPARLKSTGVFLLMCSSCYSAWSINLLWPFLDC